ncbi:hypothetical protein LCGC14_0674590 [marine sediment metagenome]|uniref:Uncharacterized protein n=1 Tax=marine sediment metagenome TaxID=412755 RepID=A0A0F9RA47_9ZZZZ
MTLKRPYLHIDSGQLAQSDVHFATLTRIAYHCSVENGCGSNSSCLECRRIFDRIGEEVNHRPMTLLELVVYGRRLLTVVQRKTEMGV